MNAVDYKNGIVFKEDRDYTGVKCVCQHCGHEWNSRGHTRPPTCAAQCSRQWYWYMTPAFAPKPRDRDRRKKSKKAA
jgi:hypothetical protein